MSTSPRTLGTAPRCPCFVRDISRKAPSVPRTGSFSRRRLHHWTMMLLLQRFARIRTRSFSVPCWNPSLGGRCPIRLPTSSLGQSSTPRRRARNRRLLFVASRVGARRNRAQSGPCGRNLHLRLVFCPFLRSFVCVKVKKQSCLSFRCCLNIFILYILQYEYLGTTIMNAREKQASGTLRRILCFCCRFRSLARLLLL